MVGEIPVATFLTFFIYLLIPFLFGFAAKKIKVSPLIGYMIGGVLLGNFFSGYVSTEIINNFAYFGIVLLLFTVGLEVDLAKMAVLKKFIVLGGLLQILLSCAAISILSMFFGFNALAAILVGLAFSSSSTTIVAKIIQDRGEENSFLGEIAMGILMFQDLAFIPFVIIFTSFSSDTSTGWELTKTILLGILEASAILWIMYYFGRKIIPIVFNRIAKTSRELLNLFIIIFIFLIALISSLFGIPILISAFIAGVLVSQTLEHHHIFSQIRPLRDLMAIIFFVFIGSNIVLAKVVFILPKILIFGALVTLVKGVIVLLTFLYYRFNSRLSFSLATYLFQVSETAFILLSIGLANRIFTRDEYLFLITTILISLMLTPFFVSNKEVLYKIIRSFFKRFLPPLELFIKRRIDFDQSPLDEFNIKNHVILCGYGRVGSQVGRALNIANIPFIAIDYNFQTVERAKQEGVNIIYGDPTDLDILDFAECENALVLVSAVPAKIDQESVILNAKKLNPKIIIISRVHNNTDQRRMKDLGVHLVIQPEIEASIAIIKRIFMLKKLSREEILKWLKALKLVQPVS